MALPIIYYNASSGSDTNPADAVASSVTTSQTVSYVSTNVISFSSAVDISAAAQDGSDYIWTQGSAGDRHLFQITGINAGTWSAATQITVAESVPAGLSASAWHVNGSRLTDDSDTTNPDEQDYGPGWIAEYEAGTYTRTVARRPGFNHGSFAYTDPPITIRAATGAASRPSLDTQANVSLLQCTNGEAIKSRGVKYTSSTGGGSGTRIITVGGGSIILLDCVVEGQWNAIQASNVSASVLAVGCWLTTTNLCVVASASTCTLINCVLDGSNLSQGEAVVQAYSRMTMIGCLLFGGDNYGVELRFTSAFGQITIINNTIVDNASHGIFISGSDGNCSTCTIRNNIIAYNGGYGANSPTTGPDGLQVDLDYNCVFSNTSGGYNGDFSAGPNDITISTDPFTNRAGSDYTLDPTDGASLIEAAYPGANGWPDGT